MVHARTRPQTIAASGAGAATMLSIVPEPLSIEMISPDTKRAEPHNPMSAGPTTPNAARSLRPEYTMIDRKITVKIGTSKR